MDKEDISQRLALTEESIARGERHLAQQRKLIEDLRRDGHRTTEAEQPLQMLEDAQALHIVERDRLRATLAKLNEL